MHCVMKTLKLVMYFPQDLNTVGACRVCSKGRNHKIRLFQIPELYFGATVIHIEL